MSIETPKKQVVFYLAPDLKARLRREAEYKHRSMNQQLTIILERHFGLRHDVADANPTLPDAGVYTDAD